MSIKEKNLPDFVNITNADKVRFIINGISSNISWANIKAALKVVNDALYIKKGEGLSLGETSITAYRGDRGKIAYDHTSLTGAAVHGVTKAAIGLGNVDNTSDLNKPVSTAQLSALNLKADLVDGLVPYSQLPASSFTVEEYADFASFPVSGESDIYYKALDTGLVYVWGGTEYALISGALALGESVNTAYRGDRGKTAYDHSQTTGNPHFLTPEDIGLSFPTDFLETASGVPITTNLGVNITVGLSTFGLVLNVGAGAPLVSSGGQLPNITIPAATNAVDGYATAAHIQAIEANTAKVTNATHTGDVTGSGVLTIANKVSMTASSPLTVTGSPQVIASGAVALSISPATNAVPGHATAAQIQAIEAATTHSALTNKHIDHTTVSILPGTGMSGGGDISANRTLNCTITQYTDALARTACLASSIVDNDLTHAPDGNSVYDALALKANTNQKLDDFGTPDDNTDLNANTSRHGLMLKAVEPAAGLINVTAIGNGESIYSNKPLFDSNVPSTQAFNDTAAAGTSVIAARRDHKHAMMPTPTDTVIVFSDVTTNNASTTKHGFLVKATEPVAGLRNVVGIDNGESAYTNKALFDANSPSTQVFGDTAVVGTAMAAARRDHKHTMPASPVPTPTAESDFIVGNPSPFGTWVKKTLAETKTILGLFLTQVAQSVGFTLSGGTDSRTLTVTANTTLSGTPYTPGGTDVSLLDGGTGISAVPPGAVLIGPGVGGTSLIAISNTSGVKLLTADGVETGWVPLGPTGLVIPGNAGGTGLSNVPAGSIVSTTGTNTYQAVTSSDGGKKFLVNENGLITWTAFGVEGIVVGVSQGGTGLTSMPKGSIFASQADNVCSLVTSSNFPGQLFLKNVLGTISWAEAPRMPIISVLDYQVEIGEDKGDQSIRIGYADAAARAAGASLYFPGGTYMVSQLVFQSGSNWIGEGRNATIIKSIAGSNKTVVIAANFATNWDNPSPTNIVVGATFKNLTIDGNWKPMTTSGTYYPTGSPNNNSGSGLAFYGARPILQDVFIKNCAEYGLITGYKDITEGHGNFGMEGFISNLRIDYTGKHGWWNKGPNDLVAIGVSVIDSSQITNNMYSNFYFEGQVGGVSGASGRFIAIHGWTRGVAAKRPQFCLYLGTDTYCDFEGGCHFEGAYTTNVFLSTVNGAKFDATTQYYAVRYGQTNIMLAGGCAFNEIRGSVGTSMEEVPGNEVTGSTGIMMGASAGNTIFGNIVELTMSNQKLGNINFVSDSDHCIGNKIRLHCYNDAAGAVQMVGVPGKTDDMDSMFYTSNGVTHRQNRVQRNTTTIQAGSSYYWEFTVAPFFPFKYQNPPVITLSVQHASTPIERPPRISEMNENYVRIWNDNAIPITVHMIAHAND